MAKESRGFEFGRIRGIPLELDASWFIIAALVTFALRGQFGLNLPGESDVGLWAAAVLGALLFFGSVLVHELSHSLVAQARGIGVRRIRLFIFGGVSELEQEAEDPADEFAVTIVGPLSSLVLGGVFYLAAQAVSPISGLLSSTLAWLAGVNVLLGVFNLVPGFPLDGGRVLRAGVWRLTNDRRRANRIAVLGGKTVSWAMMLLGAFVVAAGSLAGIWYGLLGLYLLRAADAAGRQYQFDEALRGVTVEMVMQPIGPQVSPALPLHDFQDEVLERGGFEIYPVVDPWGRTVGVVEVERLRAVPAERWDTTNVGRVMRPLAAGAFIDGGTPLRRIVEVLLSASEPLIVMADGKPVGSISRREFVAFTDRASLGHQ